MLAHEGEHHPDAMTASLEKLKGKEFESMFLMQMIHHHESAVEMAKLATSNTKRAELNKFGNDIVTAQKAEIDQMQGWLKQDGESAGSMKEMPRMEKMMAEMEGLKKAKDAEFDKMFLSMMSEHHKGGVAMSKLVADRTDRADLKQLASKIIKDQTKEIEQMKGWEKTWFGSAH
ncbi:MAG: DUF305 domain-containing protein [Verrucomicrobiota bacterium]|nr:DUF305 domain-containing protein [Verrucomicrobiota bacterium]